MGLARAMMGSGAVFFTAGSIVMIVITFLGGVSNEHPLNIIFFLEAFTGEIPGAPTVTRWTFWDLCRVDANGKSHCPGRNIPDFPFNPPGEMNFNTTVNVPPGFIGTDHFYITSRFIWPFTIITIFFAVIGFFVGTFSLCTRVGSFAAAVLTWIALIFQTIATCLMTAIYVQGRNNFEANGQAAELGQIAFGLMWASMPTLFIAAVCYLIAGFVDGKSDQGYTGREFRRRGFFPSRRSPSAPETEQTGGD